MAKRERTLIRWGLVSENGRGPYLAGLQSDGQTRTSTPLVAFDPATGTALTASGRPYVLVGEARPAYGLAVALDVWGGYFDMRDSDVRALSPDEAAALIVERGNLPIVETPEERAARARRYGVRLDDSGEVLGPDWTIPDPVPLGYDTSGDFNELARRMADDALSGRHEEAVAEEMARLRAHFGGDPDLPNAVEGGEDIEPWGSGNPFEDLGLPDPAVLLAPADAALAIAEAIWERGLSIEDAAGIAGIEPDRLRGIVEQGRTGGVSLERLDKVFEAIAAHGDWRKP